LKQKVSWGEKKKGRKPFLLEGKRKKKGMGWSNRRLERGGRKSTDHSILEGRKEGKTDFGQMGGGKKKKM